MKVNKTLKILTGLVLVTFLASCVPESIHPISDVDKAVIDSRLTGAWTGKIEDGLIFIHFLPKSEEEMEVIVISYSGKLPQPSGATAPKSKHKILPKKTSFYSVIV